jgi:membrane fusion protein, copper/silver efflux system
MKTKVLTLALMGLLLAGLGYAFRNSFRGWWQPKELPGQSASAEQSTPTAGAPARRKILYYQDPMHPWYKSDKPGIAPDCGMKLVPVYADEQPGRAAAPGVVHLSPGRQQLIGVALAAAAYRALDKTIRTVGQVDIDETRVASVHPRVSGWVQKVFVDSSFQHVMKGDPLFTIYSPDLLATEQEYLLALKARQTLSESPIREVESGGQTLLDAARRRLSLSEVTPEQIQEMEQTGKPQREITFYSPATGHALERKVFANQYVTPESELYKISDHAVMWVYAAVYEFEIPFVSVGQQAVITAAAFPGQTFRGSVSTILPHLMDETRTVRVRIELPNPELKLKPGMFVNVELHRGLGRVLTVPVDAVLDSGERQRVFVDRGDGYFEPREVEVSERAEDYAVITRGLRPGDRVVTRANFLLDSESNLRQALSGMQGMPGMQHEAGGPESGAKSAPPAATSKEHQYQVKP